VGRACRFLALRAVTHKEAFELVFDAVLHFTAKT